jgi:ribosome-binding ATPase YchF (GTP1/OBG family)
MKIGVVGYQGSGKSSLFEWLTGVAPEPSKAHQAQAAMAPVPDDRIEPLCGIYSPKKITMASLELVDTPGLSRDHEGNAARLALIREASCLVMVIGAYAGFEPSADLNCFEEDLLLADLEILTGRVERLRESVKKPRPSREEEQAELTALEPLVTALEEGTPLHQIELSDEQRRATRSFRLLTEKPRLVILNVADDEDDLEGVVKPVADRARVIAVPIGLQLELERMSPEDRTEMIEEMGLELFDRDSLLRTIMDASDQMLYFTAGEKEVRTWMLRKGGTALEAAENIHTDLARGFIRAEVMGCEDLIRLGGEREIKAEQLVYQQPKDYVIADGDILNIKFSV